MIYLKKSHLIIAFLTLILSILLIQIFFPKTSPALESFKEETHTGYPKLLAPDRAVKEFHNEKRICYLTFDDGPSENTEKILDILKEFQIPATFFVIGEELTEERKPTLQRIIDEGHAIGMHANVHVYEKLYASLDSFLKDYETLYETLKNDYGIETALFRLPGGSACNCLKNHGKEYIQEMALRGFSCFDWNISGEDSVGSPTVASIQKNVLTKGLECRRAYVLLHDSAIASKTPEALPEIIRQFQDSGFVFESLENAESYIFPVSR